MTGRLLYEVSGSEEGDLVNTCILFLTKTGWMAGELRELLQVGTNLLPHFWLLTPCKIYSPFLSPEMTADWDQVNRKAWLEPKKESSVSIRFNSTCDIISCIINWCIFISYSSPPATAFIFQWWGSRPGSRTSVQGLYQQLKKGEYWTSQNIYRIISNIYFINI